MSPKRSIHRDRTDIWSTIAFFFGGIGAIIGCFVAILASVRHQGDAITWGLAIASVGVALVAFADAIDIRAARVWRAARVKRDREHSSSR
ncbi:hypothetical protein CLV47_101388 [Antricoccus suffuscus]|uniref:Uncharacterized protein n=1 Tax=Antricoccus suffuscus TaxID=1629062 RepID=A0A2T1A6M5_9ACTN|nr:hypothetical protein [Antricoccus suffuscus]PRZ44262.1 hypothetical protein CLV47_101388 [Antricoccus suffuscus]